MSMVEKLIILHYLQKKCQISLIVKKFKNFNLNQKQNITKIERTLKLIISQKKLSDGESNHGLPRERLQFYSLDYD